MKKIVILLLVSLGAGGCATHRYDAHTVVLPANSSSARDDHFVTVRIDRQTGESWFWYGYYEALSRPEWRRIAEPSEPKQK